MHMARNGSHQTLPHRAYILPFYSTIQAQVLVRWALQHEYLSVPRTSSKSKIERQAFLENSYDGVKDFVLSQEEMKMLDELDEQLPAGRLRITDGWLASDIVDERWDPTLAVV
jgi:diketogulonate reductase-like aldo/keto reductase